MFFLKKIIVTRNDDIVISDVFIREDVDDFGKIQKILLLLQEFKLVLLHSFFFFDSAWRFLSSQHLIEILPGEIDKPTKEPVVL